MASASAFQDEFNCSICLDLLNDPVTVPCGHSFCLNCITGCWDQEDHKGVYSCPQCRETFTPRPVLRKNTMMADVLEKLKKTSLQSDAVAASFAGPDDVDCDFCTENKHKAVKSCLTCLGSYCEIHIQPHHEVTCLKRHKLVKAISQLQEKICPQHDRVIDVFCRTDEKLICMLCLIDNHNGHKTVSAAAERTEKQKKLVETKRDNQTQLQQREKELQEVKQALETLKASAEEAVEDAERIFTELISFMEKKRSEVTKSIRAQERAEVSRAEGLLEQLELEIAKLKNRDEEMEQLIQREDHIDFLKGFDSCCSSPVSEIHSSLTFTPNVTVTEIRTSAFMEIKELMLKVNPEDKAESQGSQSTHPQGEVDSTERRFRIGDRVRVKAAVTDPVYHWGNVTHRSVGVVKDFALDGMLVDFPECSGWLADQSEMELVL